MTINSEQLREIMRHWASGVSLVTSAAQGERQGMTVSSFTSVSLTPPLILVCLETVTSTRQFIARSHSFAVSILGTDQETISDRFAGRHPELIDRFAGLELRTTPAGHPVPASALAFIDCKVVDELQAGTHTIYVAEVLGGDVLHQDEPLLYYDRAYRKLNA
jgi:flavin reductase (DIM6/NTAB) family NADH-FMN oxidoreductase RutF